ncbi:MAG TPA: hypothetical protein VLW50_33305 [Streptosporangiaceae bacterium]|nr:hypothetical protein [Streptosporangiaceae bacterium]
MPERLEVQRAVAASAGEIFAVLTDPRGHVAIDSSGMLMEASGGIVTKGRGLPTAWLGCEAGRRAIGAGTVMGHAGHRPAPFRGPAPGLRRARHVG